MQKLRTITLLLALSTPLLATPGEHPMVKMPKEFDRITALVGTWEGTSDMKKGEGGQADKVTVEYTKTAGGSAIIEKLFPGSPHEMTSVYHAEKNKVAMTHYCMLGNHPTMKLKKATDTKLEFEMAGTAGVTSLKEPHMHSLTITFATPDQMTQEWTSYANGKKAETATFTLTRKAP